MVDLKNEKILALKSRIRGGVLLPGDPGYDAARTIWNAMIDRKPRLIAQCMGAADVIHAIAFARAHGLVVSVRGAGHGIAGNAVCDDGLMIDLSRMKAVHVNPQTRRAYVEPGATLADFDQEAQAFGLATPLGINSTTGVAGLTLGGGFGWLTRLFGLTCDNLVGANVITADGNLLHVNSEEYPDLFWAIRGGGGNFGVVTLFEFNLHPVGPELLCGLIVFPFSEAEALLTNFRDFIAGTPEELNVWAVLRKAPPLPFLPADVYGREVVVFPFIYVGNPETGRRQIEPLRNFAKPHGEFIGIQPYTAWQKILDPLLTPGARNYWKSHNFTQLDDETIGVVLDYAGRLPSTQCEIFIGDVSGRANMIPTSATAYSQRDAKLILNVHGRWDKSGDDEECIGWARSFFKAAAPRATGGVYVNFLTNDETDRIRAAYGENYSRLVELKNKYDPSNVFSMNQNIKPAAARAA